MTKNNINISLACAASTIILAVLMYYWGYYNSINWSAGNSELNTPLVVLSFITVFLIVIIPIIGIITGVKGKKGIPKYIGISLNTVLLLTVSLLFVFMTFLYTP